MIYLTGLQGLVTNSIEQLSLAIGMEIQTLIRVFHDALPAIEEHNIRAGDLMGRVKPLILDPLENTAASILREAPSNLVDGVEIALYKKIQPFLVEALKVLASKCSSSGNEQLAGIFTEEKEKLERRAQSLQEYKDSIISAFSVLKRENVHFFGQTLQELPPINVNLSFEDLEVEREILSRGVRSPNETSAQNDFEEQKNTLIRNLERVALIEVVYKLVIGKNTNHLSSIIALENKDDFDRTFFEILQLDIKEYFFPYRIAVLVTSYILYKLAFFIIHPCMEEAGKVGYDAVINAINTLHEEKNANALHDHIFESLKVYFDNLSEGYEKVASESSRGATGLSIHERVLKWFEKSKEIHLGRTKEEFYGEIIDHVVKYLPLFYPIRVLIGFFLKQGQIFEKIFAKIEVIKKDKESFSYVVEKALLKSLKELETALNSEEEEEEMGEIGQLKREQIYAFFEALFDATTLANLPTRSALVKRVQEANQAQESYDSVMRQYLITPALRGATDSFAKAVKKGLSPQLVQKVMTLALEIVNSSYSPEIEITEAEKMQTRKELKEVQERIFDISIQKGMEGIPFLYAEQETFLANQYIAEIKEKAQIYEQEQRNAYILAMQGVEKRLKKERKIGATIKQELTVLYLQPLAQALRDSGDLQAIAASMPPLLCYDPIGEGIAGFSRDSAKGIAKQIVAKKVDEIRSLALHPSMVPYGIGNYLLFRPFLQFQGVKNLSN